MANPITQSNEWQKLQDDLGEKSFHEQGDDFYYLAVQKSTPVGNYFYLPYGPVYTSKTGRSNAIKAIHSLAKHQDVFFVRIEPQDPDFLATLPENSVKTIDQNPAETWILDLSGNDDELKAKLPSRLLRYYKNRDKQGITIETSKNPADIKHLLRLQKALASEKGISTFSESYLETELKQPFSTLYLVKQEEPTTGKTSIVAAGLVFDHEDTRYNLQGAQSEQGRKLHATGILTIQLILDAKKKGLKTFDFWGIAPEGAPKDHPWAGFTNFKKTFAGREVKYAGTYDLVINRNKYRIYRFLRKINRMMHR